jgi:hypothetical protein
MSRVEVDNGYFMINLAPGETITESNIGPGGAEITFDSVRAAREAMDLLAAALCDTGLDDGMMS